MVRKSRPFVFALSACVVIGVAAGSASSALVINTVTGTPYAGTVTQALIGGGTDQVGLLITVQYTTFTESRSWIAENSNKGGVKSAAHVDSWELFADANGPAEGTFGDSDETLSGNGILDTLNERWEFKQDFGKLPANSVLEKITLDGSLAGIVFDRPVLNGVLIATPYSATEPSGDPDLTNPRPHEGADDRTIVGNADEFGTAGSARGRDFYSMIFDNAPNERNVDATYMNRVGTFGDLYTKVVIDFLNGGLGSSSGISSFTFAIDTDKTSGLSVVPEPAAFLFGGVVCTLVGIRLGGRRVLARVHRRDD